MIQRLGPLALLTSLVAAGCPNTCAVKLDDGVGLPCDDHKACLPGTYCADDDTCQPGDPDDAAIPDRGVTVDGGDTDAIAIDGAALDAARRDSASADALEVPDAVMPDALSADTAVGDAASIDSAAADAAIEDASIEDALIEDGAPADTLGSPDQVAADAAAPDIWSDDSASATDAAMPDVSIPDLLTADTARADTSIEDAVTCNDAARVGFSADPVAGTTLGQRVPVLITFDQPVVQITLTLAGEMATSSDGGAWLSATELLVSPDPLWGEGMQALIIEVQDLCGESLSVTVDYQVQVVVPLYPNNGLDWNDYLLNDGGSFFSASDTPCTGDESGPVDACLHGGELRIFYVAGASDCTDLTASDERGAFDWICMIDAELDRPVFVSTGLKPGAALSDLIDFGTRGWSLNHVQVRQGPSFLQTTPDESWWYNPVQENNAGAALTGGTIHLVTSDPVQSYTFTEDGAALLIEPGVTFSADSGTPAELVLSATDLSFLWVEGAVSGAGDDIGVAFDNVTFSALRRLTVSGVDTGTYQHAIDIYTGGHNRLDNIAIHGQFYEGLVLSGGTEENTVRGVTVDGAAYASSIGIAVIGTAQRNHLEELQTSNCDIGLDIENGSQDNLIEGARFSNCGDSCVLLALNAVGNVLQNVVTNNSVSGIRFSNGAHDNTLLNITAISGSYGVEINGPVGLARHHNLFMNLATMNNLRNLSIDSPSYGNRVIGLAAGNGGYGVDLGNASPTYFHGLLKVGSNTFDDCAVTATGLGLEANCSNSFGSFATLTTGVLMDRTFLGPVTDEDVVNQSDTSGSRTYDDITDWFSFEDLYRAWGAQDSSWPSDNSRNACKTGNVCHIYDWRLTAGDPGDANDPVVLDVLPVPTGDDTYSHSWSNFRVTTFLANAVELVGDGVGDDDGLCESDETCLYTPNLGAYQGHGGLITVPFTPGTITGVTLLRQQDNGIP